MPPVDDYDVAKYRFERRVDGDYLRIRVGGHSVDAKAIKLEAASVNDVDSLVRLVIKNLHYARIALSDSDAAEAILRIDTRPTPPNIFELIYSDDKFGDDLQAARQSASSRIFIYAENYVRAIAASAMALSKVIKIVVIPEFESEANRYIQWTGTAKMIRDSIEHREERTVRRGMVKGKIREFTPGPLDPAHTGPLVSVPVDLPILSIGNMFGGKYHMTSATGENIAIPISREHLREAVAMVESALSRLPWPSWPGPTVHFI